MRGAGKGLALFSIVAAAATIAPGLARHGSSPPTASREAWAIVATFKGDSFVLDAGLSHDDCDDSKPADQPRKGLAFTCQLIRDNGKDATR